MQFYFYDRYAILIIYQLQLVLKIMDLGAFLRKHEKYVSLIAHYKVFV